MAKKYKGVAQIELTNVNTGEVTTQVEENIVTNAIANILTQNPWGAVGFRSYSNLAQMMSGVMLFDKTISENVNNTMIPFDPVSWAGDVTNTGSQTRRGNINNPACFVSDTGCQLVWEWNTSQGNGTYKCIGLGHPSLCDTDDWGNVNLGSVLGTHNVVTLPYSGAENTDFNNTCLGSMTFYDDKKGYFYNVIVAVGGKEITITRVFRPCHKLPVGQVNHWDASKYNLNKAIGGELIKDKRTIVKTVNTSLTFNQSGYTRTNAISASMYNNELYLFSLQNGKTSVLLTKINLNGDFTEAGINITQEVLDFQGAPARVYAAGTTQAYTQMKDSVCFKYPYLYIPNMSEKTVWKCNITDQQDITELETSYTGAIMCQREGIILGNYYVNFNGYKINLSENKVIPCTIGVETSAYYALNLIGNEYIRYAYVGSSVNSAKFKDRLFVNPFYLATINNVTPFTKTSDHTLKITYTITEVD